MGALHHNSPKKAELTSICVGNLLCVCMCVCVCVCVCVVYLQGQMNSGHSVS